jgi:hypothetical protein
MGRFSACADGASPPRVTPWENTMGIFRTTGQRASTAGQLFSFFWSNKRWWLTPILITLAVFAVLLILAQSSAIAPFIYTFF